MSDDWWYRTLMFIAWTSTHLAGGLCIAFGWGDEWFRTFMLICAFVLAWLAVFLWWVGALESSPGMTRGR